jgi:hypothetical protein
MSCGLSRSDNMLSASMFALAIVDLSQDKCRLGPRLLHQYRSTIFTFLFETML